MGAAEASRELFNNSLACYKQNDACDFSGYAPRGGMCMASAAKQPLDYPAGHYDLNMAAQHQGGASKPYYQHAPSGPGPSAPGSLPGAQLHRQMVSSASNGSLHSESTQQQQTTPYGAARQQQQQQGGTAVRKSSRVIIHQKRYDAIWAVAPPHQPGGAGSSSFGRKPQSMSAPGANDAPSSDNSSEDMISKNPEGPNDQKTGKQGALPGKRALRPEPSVLAVGPSFHEHAASLGHSHRTIVHPWEAQQASGSSSHLDCNCNCYVHTSMSKFHFQIKNKYVLSTSPPRFLLLTAGRAFLHPSRAPTQAKSRRAAAAHPCGSAPEDSDPSADPASETLTDQPTVRSSKRKAANHLKAVLQVTF